MSVFKFKLFVDLLKPYFFAAQAAKRAFASHTIEDFKHRRADRLTREHCARGVNEESGFNARFFGELAKRGFRRLMIKRFNGFQAHGEGR